MDADIFAIIRAYPQIYMACHVDHRDRRSSSTGLTSREATILAHIEGDGMTPSALAEHLGIARSTLSPSVRRLAALGMITVESHAQDRRRKTLSLTSAGRAAIAQGSVLDPERVKQILRTMDRENRQKAVEGLALLAKAARRWRDEHS